MKTAICYLRVSTREQTVLNQKLFLEQWAAANNYAITRIFEDPATSGTIPAFERRGFRGMMQYLRNSPVDAVLVFELSRLGRKFWDSLEIIKEVDSYAPLIACSPKEQFLQSTDPSVRKLLIGILTWVSEREREVLIERIKAGMARAKSQGITAGRKPKEVNWQLFEQLTRDGYNIDDIARHLGVCKLTLYRKIRARLKEGGRT
jgi:DNA invertase Pin-like site-specific DNA recombinase